MSSLIIATLSHCYRAAEEKIQRSSCLTLFLRDGGRKLFTCADHKNIQSQIKNLLKFSELLIPLFRFIRVFMFYRNIMSTVCKVTNSTRSPIKLNKESTNLLLKQSHNLNQI